MANLLSTWVSGSLTSTGRIIATYNTDRYQFNLSRASGSNWWFTNDTDKLGLHINNVGDKFYFGTGGDFWSESNGWLSTALAAKQNASTAITTSNIGSQSVSYASNADTVDSLHASDFVRAYTTTSDNIDSNWGQSFKTFDPVPSGTPPIASPNLRTINIGESFSRRTQLAFDYATDRAWFRRRDDGGWQTWREFIHSGNIGSQNVNSASYSNYVIDSSSVRITSPVGAFSVNNGYPSGAIRINLPRAVYNNNTMMSMTVDVYEYSTGQSFTLRIGGYNYLDGGWYNVFASLINDSGQNNNIPVYFGNNGSDRNVIWIGEPNWGFAYPNVFVRDFQAGHSQNSGWASDWSISFDPNPRTNVGASRIAYKQIDAGNITSSHFHDLARYSLRSPGNVDSMTSSNFRTQLFGSSGSGHNISTARWNSVPSGLSGMNMYGTMLAWSGSDTHGFIAADYSTANIQVGGGSGDSITWKATLIHSGNIASQSVSYAVTSGTSSATTQTNFSELSIGGLGVATREYVTSQGYLTSLPSHNHDDRYLVKGGSWYGSGLPGSRWGGFTVSGGEIVFGDGLPNAGQMGILIDGAYLAGENNGFWSLASDNSWSSRRGMYWDGSYLNFTTNSPIALFSDVRASYVYATAAAGTVTAGSTSTDGMLFDSSRAAIIARGNYPHVELWADVANSNHGGTLRFGGYDNGSSGAYKSWNIGTAGNNLYFLDIGYGGSNNPNPHAGIAGLGEAYGYSGAFTSMRFHNNGNIGIGNFGTYGNGDNDPDYKLDVRGNGRYTGLLYLDAAESLNLYGIRGRFTDEYIHLYNKVGIGNPNGWGEGRVNTGVYGLSTYGGINIAYGYDGGATINTYTRINKNWAGGDYGAEQFTIRGTYPSIALRSTQHNNVWLIHNDDNVSFYYGSGVDSNNWSRRFFIPTDGNIWMSWAGDYLSNLLNAKQNASTAITTSNIGSQSVSYAASAGDSTNLGGASSSRYVRNDIYNSVDAGLQVFRNIGTIDGSWPSSDHTFGLENSDAGTIVVNFHRAGYTSNNLWYNGSQFRFDQVVSSTSAMLATIFYDYSNTNRYLDLNSTAADAMVISGGIHISRDNVTGNGIILADDGDIVDLNDGYCAMRFSFGVRVHSGNRTGSAVHTLHSDGNAYFNTSAQTPIFLVNNHSDNTKGYRIHNTSGSSVSAMFTNSANALVIGAGAFDQVQLNKKTLINGAALGVNVAPSGTAGRIDASNDIVAYSSSDERLKQNITPIENALDKVKSLTGVEFDWKPEYKHTHGYEGHDTGIIAQQVQDVMPSAVRTNDTGFLAVRYEKLIGLLIEANKELAARVEELEKKLS